MKKAEIKLKLIEICQNALVEKMKEHEQAMEDAQKEANFHKGAMESRYDSFKEEAQDRKDAHARQVAEITKLLSALHAIKEMPPRNVVDFGSVVQTEGINYFIFSYIFTNPVEINGEKFLPINLLTPLGKQFKGKTVGDEVFFRNKKFKITDVY